MDRYIKQLVIFALILLLWGCGQVGIITGGEDDYTAPRPLSEKMSPPMASKNTKPERIVIPFDEFISLNNPLQNIRVVPDNVKLNYRIKGKSLIIEKESGEWLDNTTYAIYFKRAIKDITEGNDSIMTYVFATGPFIDSLTFAVRVVHAFTNKPLENILIGVYPEPLLNDTSKISPTYAGITDKEGVCQFLYLTEGPYYVYAIDDQNKNNRLNPTERRGAVQAPVYADTTIEIIHEIRLMPPLPVKNEVKTIEFTAPAQFDVKFTKPLDESVALTFVGPTPINLTYTPRRDSLTILYANLPKSGKIEFVVDHPDFQDTIRKKYFYREIPPFDIRSNLDKGVLPVDDTLRLTFSDAIQQFDTSLVQLYGRKKGDTLSHSIDFSMHFSSPNVAYVVHERSYDSVRLHLPKHSFSGYTLKQHVPFTLSYEIQASNKVGSLVVTLDSIPPAGILQLLTAKQDVLRESILVSGQNDYSFERLQPGMYSFRIILDNDGDGFWSTGDIFTGKEAERVIWFDSTSQVRANWDVTAKISLIESLPIEE